MKFLRGLLIFLLISFVIYCVVMFFLPKTYVLERTVTINAKPAKVYTAVMDFNSWDSWSYWNTMDSTNVTTVKGEMGMVGSGYTWTGNVTGEGEFTVTKLEENQRIDFDLMFAGQDPATGYFTFEPIGEGETEVTYAFIAEFGFFDRVNKIFFDIFVGEGYEQSLAALKEYVESLPDAPSFTVEELDVEPMPYIGIRTEMAMADLTPSFFNDNYRELSAFLKEDTTTITAPPMAFYEVWDEENARTTVVVAFATTSTKEPNDRVMKGMTHQGKVLKVAFYGPYEATGAAHEALEAYASENNMQIVGAPYEVYVTSPASEPDTSKWLTEIYYPVAMQ